MWWWSSGGGVSAGAWYQQVRCVHWWTQRWKRVKGEGWLCHAMWLHCGTGCTASVGGCIGTAHTCLYRCQVALLYNTTYSLRVHLYLGVHLLPPPCDVHAACSSMLHHTTACQQHQGSATAASCWQHMPAVYSQQLHPQLRTALVPASSQHGQHASEMPAMMYSSSSTVRAASQCRSPSGGR